MMKNRLFTTSILIAATTAAGFFGCSSNTGGDSSVGTGSSSGSGVGSGSSSGVGSNSSSSGSGSSGGAGQTGDAGACMPPSSVPAASVPGYVAVMSMTAACNSMQIAGFISSCVATGATANGCQQWAGANSTCAGCIVQGGDAGATETGAILFNAQGQPVSGNVPGCIALTDPANGPQCAAQLEPLMQCVALACGMCTNQTSFSNCEKAAKASGGACGDYASNAQMPCADALASGGVGVTKCGYGTPNELQNTINVICGSGGS